MNKIKIVSDGTAFGTKMFDAKGLEMDVSAVESIQWSVDGKTGLAMATVRYFACLGADGVVNV